MRVIRAIKQPRRIVLHLAQRGFFDKMDDVRYLKMIYKLKTGHKLDLENPRTFNEKIQWLKLYDRKKIYNTYVDKCDVKEYIKDTIGEKYVIPTLGVWNKFDDIEFDKLPEKFVLKCTHDSGGLVIVKDKSLLDIDDARRKIESSLKKNYYYMGREWPYKDVKPRIIAEAFLEDGINDVPKDYKIYCMNGEPKYIVVFHNRFSEIEELSETVYDINWNVQNISLDNHFKISNIVDEKPDCLEELLDVCKKICKDMKQVRVDFYIINNNIYFGEITLHTASGFQPMIPENLDLMLGNELKLIDE